MTSRNYLPRGGTVTQSGSGQQINVFGSASQGSSSKICGRRTAFTDDGKMIQYATIDVTGDAESDVTTEFEARITLNGKRTIIPAPAGRVTVRHGLIYQNGKLFKTENKLST